MSYPVGSSQTIPVDVPTVLNALDYGAVGDGLTHNLAALKTLTAALRAANGGRVWFPAGVFDIEQDGGSAWCWDIGASNVSIEGIPGQTWFRQSTSVINPQIALIRANEVSNITFRNIGFDGNWGNPVTYITATTSAGASTIPVRDTTGFPSAGSFILADRGTTGQTITYGSKTATSFTQCTGLLSTAQVGMACGRQDSNDGLNFPTPVDHDPKNHGLAIRGCTNVLIDNCYFKQNYGDGIWIGHGATSSANVSSFVYVSNCFGDVCARDGISLGGPCNNISVTKTRWTNHFSKGFDVETDNTHSVVIDDDCYFGGWFNASNHTGATALVVKWNVNAPDEAKIPRNYRIMNSTFVGPCIFEGCEDLQFVSNRVELDWAGICFAPVFLQFYAGSNLIAHNYIYDRAGQQGTSHQGSIALFGAPTNQQSSVVIFDNTIKAKNGNNAIKILSPGGTAGDSGTASATGATSLTDGSKSWTADAYVHHYVRRGNAIGMVTTNSATVLTIQSWMTATGLPIDTPATGAYEILATGRYVDVLSNHIDCTDDGNGAGGFGIAIAAASTSPGARIRCNANDIRNATTDAINVAPPGSAPNAWRHLELKHNVAFDDQVTPTCTGVVRFTTTTPSNINVLDMGDNRNGGGVANVLSGLTGGTWRVSGGSTEQWMGFGSPLNVVVAPIGSIYQRVDGGANTTLYVKESGNGASTGWVAK